MNEELNPFQVEVPEPLAPFRETIQHPENVDVYKHDNRAKKLPANRQKIIKQQKEELQAVLVSYDYDAKKERLEVLRQRWNEIILEENSGGFDPKEIRYEKHMIRKEVVEIRTAIEPAKVSAAKLQRILNRIDEHNTAVANEILYKELRTQMAKEVSLFASIIVDVYNRLGYCFDYTVKGKNRRQAVRFEKAIATEDQIQLKLSVSSLTLLEATRNHLPNGVKVADLVSEQTLNELSAATERHVTSPHYVDKFDFRNGAWLVVNRLGLTDGLFNYISLEQILKRYEDAKREKFPLPLGVRPGRRINWVNLAEQPHLMLNGQPGSGKTNAIRGIICTLINKHSPDEVRILLVDLKRGGDFSPFDGVQHLLMPVITDIHQLSDVMQRIRALMYQRMEEIKSVKAIDINNYNKMVQENRRMPRLLVVIDEYTALTMNKVAKQIIDHEATILSTQSRAAGIHLMIGNQQAYAHIVPPSVRSNVTIVLSGRQRTMGGSMSTFGNNSATKLPKIPGRMLCDDGMDTYQVQLPHARFEDIAIALDAASNYPSPRPLILPGDDVMSELITEAERPFTVDDVIRIAIEEFDGKLTAKNIYEVSKDRVSQSVVRDLVKEIAEVETLEFEGETYELQKERNYYRLVIRDTQVVSFVDGETAITDDLSHQLDHQLEFEHSLDVSAD